MTIPRPSASSRRSVRAGIIAGAISAIFGLSPTEARAGNTWDGGSALNGNWSNVQNWDADTLPDFLLPITFAGMANLLANNDLNLLGVGGVILDAAAGAFTLRGNAITLNGSIVNNALTSQTINLAMTVDSVKTINVAGSSLTIGPGGTSSGVISGFGGINKTGAGTLLLSGANTYSGPTSIGTTAVGGTLTLGVGGTLGNGTSPLSIGLGANTGALNLGANGATVATLTVASNTATANTITIGSGQTFTVSGDVLIGGINGGSTGANPITRLNVAGNGGTLKFGSSADGTFIVGNTKGANTGGGDTINATLDLSTVSTFIADYGSTGIIGIGAGTAGTGGNAPFGTLILGANNTLTAGTLNVGLNSGGGNTGKSFLRLGTTNVLNIDNMKVGAGKTQPTEFNPSNPNPVGSLRFNSGLVNPTLTLRGAAGGNSRVNMVTVGDGELYTLNSGTDSSGVIDLSGGLVDARIDTLRVAVATNNGNAGASSYGIFSFDSGIVDITTVVLGTENPAVNNGPVTGFLNVSGAGQLNIGASGIELGHRPIAANIVTGVLNITGGIVIVGGNIFVGGGFGTVTLNGGTLDLAGHNLGISGGLIDTLNLQSGTLKNVAQINDGAVLTKSSNGTLTFAGANTYTGETIVNAGTISVVGSLLPTGVVTVNTSGTLSGTGSAGTTTIATGGSLRPGATGADGAVGMLTVAGLTVSGDIRLDLIGTGNADKVVATNTADFVAGSTVTLAGIPAAGTYVALTTAALSGTAPTLVSPTGTRSTFSLNFDTLLDQISIAVGGGPKTITWTGTNGSAWDIVGAFNWTDGGMNEQFFNLDSVIIADGPTNRDITLNTVVTPAAVTVNNSTGDYSISGTGGITGSTVLTKSGSGKLTLATENTYTGATTINSGTLQIGNGSATGSLGTGPVTNNGTLTFNHGGVVTVAADIGGTGTLQQSLGGSTVVLTGTNSYGATSILAGTLQIGDGGTSGTLGNGAIVNNGILAFNRSDAVTIGANISGSGELQQVGNGTLILTGANSYGATTILAGTVQIGNGGTTGSLGSGTITNNGTLAFSRSDSIVVNFPIVGSGALQQNGPGTLTISSGSNYGGATSVVGGTLVVGAGANLGNGAGALNVGAGTSTATLDLTVSNATASSLTVSSNSVTPNTITLGGSRSLTINGSVTVGGIVGTNITNLDVVGSTGTLLVSSPSGGTFAVTNISNAANSATVRATLDLSALGNFTVDYGPAGVIAVGASAVGSTANGPNGTLNLAATNTLTADALRVSYGGVNGGTSHLRLGTTNTLHIDNLHVATGKGAGNLVFNTGLTNPTVTIRGSDGTSRVGIMNVGDYTDYAAGGASTNSTGTVDFTGGTVDALINELTIGLGRISGQDTGTATAVGTVTFDKGTIDATTITLGKTGGGTLGGASAAGTLNVGATGTLIVGAGGMNLGAGATGATFSGTLNINGGSVTTAGDIIDGGGNSTINFNGGTLNMQGHNIGGTEFIDALNVPSGNLQNAGQINARAFMVNSAVTSGSGAVGVAINGSLSGSGSIQPGNGKTISIAEAAIIAPGDGLGTLTIDSLITSASSVLSIAMGGRFTFDLNTLFQSDKIALINGAAGDIAFAGNNIIDFTDLSFGNLAYGNYTLFTADVANAYLGFENLSIGVGLEAYPGSSLTRINNDIVLVLVPEPGSSVMLVGGAALAGSCLRIRGRRRSLRLVVD
jgi:autotransporter-associated beta strand protein